jgi:outer membrane protein TolC
MRRKILREADDAFSDLENEENNYQISLKRYHQAGLALDLAKTRYERGLSNNTDVLDAESSFSAAELGTASSLTAYNIAAVKLAYTLGLLDLSWVELAEGSAGDDDIGRKGENGE